MTARTVLVVDDDPGIRSSLGDLLRSEGYEVRSAEHGAAALAIMRQRPKPDVVVLDLMMPVMSGWEVLEEIEHDEDLQSVPILVVSAMCAPVAEPDACGGVRVNLSKPLDADVLLSALGSLVTPPSRPGVENPRASAAR